MVICCHSTSDGEAHSAQDVVIIETNQGQLEGAVKIARNGDNYHGFLGIPYAQPPTNELRWQTPRPAPGWDGIRTATQHPSMCIQHKVSDPKEILGKCSTKLLVPCQTLIFSIWLLPS